MQFSEDEVAPLHPYLSKNSTKDHGSIQDQSHRKSYPSHFLFSYSIWGRVSSLHSTTTSESALAGSVLAVTSTEGGLALASELVLIAFPSLRPGSLLLVRGGDDLGGKGQVSAEVFDALGGEVAVVVLPAEGGADVSSGLEGLHEVEDLEVGASLDVGVGGADGVLLDDEDSLAEEVGEDSDAVGLGDEHGCFVFVGGLEKDEMVYYECPDRIFKRKHEKLKL
mmetsp:Transcript_39581/g.67410  ORF Transcript_39581/g.67410 Transcript_39581/m.67410 type:complete len:223 (+) Transcript_39581:54-722(+)